jgi:ferritin-like metal-binding protein YciE
LGRQTQFPKILKILNRHNFSGSNRIKTIFMENMNQLRDLLKHEIKDLYSAEEQIIEALPKMIEKANNTELKKALKQHLQVTEKQKNRLDSVLEALNEEREEEGEGALGLFKGEQKCLAMEGIISEGKKLMKEDMSPEVTDAAIIGAAQKIEHYEISSYGTVRTYAQELNLSEVQGLLQETLDEEYEADDLLTELAESRVNEKAISESGSTRERGRSGSRKSSSNGRTARSKSVTTANASSPRAGSSSSRLRNGGGTPSKKSPGPSKTKAPSGPNRRSSSRRSGSR